MPIDREQQAIDEMARTEVAPWVAWSLVVGFLLLLLAPGLAHVALASDTLVPAAVAVPKALARGLLGGRPFEASRQTLQAIDAFETELRNGSPLAKEVRPVVQSVLYRQLGVGNAQVVVGDDDPGSERSAPVLYFRPSVQHAMGAGFLQPQRLAARRRGAPTWQSPPQPDPRQAVRHLADDLGQRGVELMVVPIPVKASVDGEALWMRAGQANPSEPAFRAHLERLGVGGPDARAVLSELPAPRFLETDTHWRPEAMDAVAEAVARALSAHGIARQRRLPRGGPQPRTGVGDLADLLGTGPGTIPPDTVEVASLRRPQDRDQASILVLGDSFAGIYADSTLGFGEGGGFVDALAHHLGQPVDGIVVNAGGAWQTRQALADQVDLLERIDVVVWLFTARELSLGDWRTVRLPEVGAVVDPRFLLLAKGERRTVEGRVLAVAPAADPARSPYPDQLVALSIAVEGVPSGAPGSVVWAYAWGLRGRQPDVAARLRRGEAVTVSLVSWSEAPPDAESAGRSEVETRPTAVPMLWVEGWSP